MDKLTPEALTFPRFVDATQLTDIVARLCVQANIYLPGDVKDAIKKCQACETSPLAADTLNKLVENYTLAEEKEMPICQDTGVTCVFLEIGEQVHIRGNIANAVNEGVRRGYAEGYLRKSVIDEPLFSRKNTGDNTPAFIYTDYVSGDRIRITMVPKGFGSENMSAVRMLQPSDGMGGVTQFVLDTVKNAGPNPCPPIVVGVGVGGTMDKAALLAKKALLRPLHQRHPHEKYAGYEAELLEKINALGIGPQGYGGKTTALAVAIEYNPTHIAGLPVAVNLNCHAARHVSEVL
ncbi:MAG: fumarate hydratase [Defluviitaleaceae bacterium]|nr:fumarate hydratase [Defluviitaleaceae bacterium]MCL2273588.1 fumarate hydratase [Defluviitaleaceae bacterium]